MFCRDTRTPRKGHLLVIRSVGCNEERTMGISFTALSRVTRTGIPLSSMMFARPMLPPRSANPLEANAVAVDVAVPAHGVGNEDASWSALLPTTPTPTRTSASSHHFRPVDTFRRPLGAEAAIGADSPSTSDTEGPYDSEGVATRPAPGLAMWTADPRSAM